MPTSAETSIRPFAVSTPIQTLLSLRADLNELKNEIDKIDFLVARVFFHLSTVDIFDGLKITGKSGDKEVGNKLMAEEWIEHQVNVLNEIILFLNKLIEERKISSGRVVEILLRETEEFFFRAYAKVKSEGRRKIPNKDLVVLSNILYTLLSLREAPSLIHSETWKITENLLNDQVLPGGQSLSVLARQNENKQTQSNRLLTHFLSYYLFPLAEQSKFILPEFLNNPTTKEFVDMMKSIPLSHLVSCIEHRFSQALFSIDETCEFKAFVNLEQDKANLLFMSSLSSAEKKRFLLVFSIFILYALIVGSYFVPANTNDLINFLEKNREILSSDEQLSVFLQSDEWLEMQNKVAFVTSGWNRTTDVTSNDIQALIHSSSLTPTLNVLNIGGGLYEPPELSTNLGAWGYKVLQIYNVDQLTPIELAKAIEKHSYRFTDRGGAQTSINLDQNLTTELAKTYLQLVNHLTHAYGKSRSLVTDKIEESMNLIIARNSIIPHASLSGLYEAIWDMILLADKSKCGIIIGGGYYPDLRPVADIHLRFNSESRHKPVFFARVDMTTRHFDKTRTTQTPYHRQRESDINQLQKHQIDRREWMNDPKNQTRSRALLTNYF